MSPINVDVTRTGIVVLPAVLSGALLSPSAAAQVEGTGEEAAPGGRTTVGELPLKPTTSCQPSWIPTFDGALGTDWSIRALTVFDDGSGPALYAGGGFTGAGGVAANHIAKWDGSSWSALGSGMDDAVYALTVLDDGSGPELYAGGAFSSAGGVAANHIAMWDGSSWSALGGGSSSDVLTLAVFDDGSGPALYAGGWFTKVGGVTANHIAKWDGSSWSALGSGTGGAFVCALTVFDDGNGPALYAGGWFDIAGGVLADRIAKWDGSSWSALGSGFGSTVQALAVFDDGSGPALYAGGWFTSTGGVAVNRIAKWDGSSWSALGSGLSGGEPFPDVRALTVLDDGSGPGLYAGGGFAIAGGAEANHIAKWDGSSWSTLGKGLSLYVFALTVFDDGSGPALYAGGGFTVSPAGDSYLAKWGCPTIASLPGCAGNPATLAALAPSAAIGKPLPLRISGSLARTGLGAVYFGDPSFNTSGCGRVLPGVGELLIALWKFPVLIANGPLAGGTCELSPRVPNHPVLGGTTKHLQGLAFDPGLPSPVELTNALAVTFGP